ncbi:putative RNA recognition motif domain, nucleotide-binding alpha-beta plait domain superfamily [Helianthus debilis subsp. tardiflorus]
MRSSSKKITRIFVARIPLSVTEAAFRSHWRDIGFVHAQGGESARGTCKKIFIGRIPEEASLEDLRLYFGRFGRILDVYIPKVI